MSGPVRIVALSGGVGGAKLALGLSRERPDDSLMVVANNGDDFDHLGLRICPDLDTLIYTLAGLSDPQRGWGRRDESWGFMSALGELGADRWFNLGDRDLALHLLRAEMLRAGKSLSEITATFSERLGIAARLVPMSDDLVPTVVLSEQGEMAFQHYFVRERCRPRVTGFRFDGIAEARPNPDFLAALGDPALEAVVIAPSNPFVSVDPILGLPGIHEALSDCAAPIVAVSPIVGGRAIKGPAAKMFDELGMPASALAVARHYGRPLDGFVIDGADTALDAQIRDLGIATLVTDTVMRNLADKTRLAREVLAFAAELRRSG